jgi:hypothetical protein
MDWSVTGPLVGVVIGGLLTAGAEALRARGTFKREKSWQVLEERRRRLEQIYEAVEAHRTSYQVAVLRLVARTTGQPLDKEALDALGGPGGKFPIARLRMLVNLYAPRLRGALADVERSTKDDYGAAFIAVMRAENAQRSRVIRETMLPAMEAIDATHDALLAKLVETAGELQTAVETMAPRSGTLKE